MRKEYVWYVKSVALWEGFISSWTSLLAHEGSHVVQPEQAWDNISGKTHNCILNKDV